MLTIAYIVTQVLSLSVMLLFIHEYKRITLKHEMLLSSIEEGKKPSSSFQSNLIIWIYAILTLVIIISTAAFLFGVLQTS